MFLCRGTYPKKNLGTSNEPKNIRTPSSMRRTLGLLPFPTAVLRGEILTLSCSGSQVSHELGIDCEN